MTESKGILDKLGDIVAEKILPKLVELLWPRLTDYFDKVVLPKVYALVPLAVASGVKAVIDEIPGIDAVRNVDELVDKVIGDVNVAVPDVDIPGISQHFDLTEFINKTLGR